jgi:pyruvate formate lyase activating enzyme
MSTLKDTLDSLTTPGKLFERLEDQVVRCTACAHRCLIRPDKRGVCLVRYNRDGILYVPWGYVAGVQVDPIEKKPFMHLYPGSDVLTFGMLGCNLHCSFCQNWLSSQALRDPMAHTDPSDVTRTTPEKLVHFAVSNGVKLIASSYNEPLITSEWAAAVFTKALEAGIKCAYVSNGYATREVLEYLRPYLSALKIDLKTFNERKYRSLGGDLQFVLETIQNAHEMGIWVEIVTLVIPNFNDSNEELWEMARFVTSVSADIPWHVTAYHPDYKMHENPFTPASALQRAADLGQEAGLRYVYAGNLPGKVGSLEDTLCPQCQTALIIRRGYTIRQYKLTSEGKCPSCGTVIAGVWTDHPQDVRTDRAGIPRSV